MLDGRPSEIGWHLGEAEVKIKAGGILFCRMHQMLSGIKPPFCIRNYRQLFPRFPIYFGQITDSGTVNLQRLAERDICFRNSTP